LKERGNMQIENVGVVGCGVMGAGITQICAQAGYKVVVSGRNKERVEKRLQWIATTLDRGVEKGNITREDKDNILGRIKGTIHNKELRHCQLVIEAVTEKLDVKKQIFAELDEICPKDAILATTTGVLSIIDMAMTTTRPEKVLGLHFMNPVSSMKLVELVETIVTSKETLEIAKELCTSLGKTFVVAKDRPGFIVNGLLVPFLLNAIRMLENNVATKEDIDTSLHLGLNHPMGPLTLLDFIGIDTVFFASNAMYEEFKDPQYAPPPLMRKMVTAGWLGRKTGRGFYEYKSS
jgi:3-hydroxybutyryl-CoA dehydrogenase